MTKFQRRLNLDILTPETLENEPWFPALLSRWYPSGAATPIADWVAPIDSTKKSGPRPLGLRVCIRKGKMNFYCAGQSIAEIPLRPKETKLSAKTHDKYLTDSDVTGQTTSDLSQVDHLHPDHGGVDGWIRRSHRYPLEEKLFIERIFAANGTLIDLEMGLPGFRRPDPKTGIDRAVAPRIDLVGLEAIEDGWQLVFWEAKLGSNDESKSTTEPQVVSQIKGYEKWLSEGTRAAEVLEAYRSTCLLLARLHQLAADLGFSLSPLHPAITAIASSKDQHLLRGLDKRVRVLIDDPTHSANWDNIHVQNLAKLGIPVHVVRSDDDLVLPHRSAMNSTGNLL